MRLLLQRSEAGGCARAVAASILPPAAVALLASLKGDVAARPWQLEARREMVYLGIERGTPNSSSKRRRELAVSERGCKPLPPLAQGVEVISRRWPEDAKER